MITPNYDLDIDSTLGGDNASDYVIPSQKAIKSYVDNNSVIPSNMVTTDTAQNITGVKTFVGQKMIGFKQSASGNKLGFTLYNNNNVEKGYLEYNPSNLIDNVPLMTLGNYATAAAGLTHVGFRKYSNISGASGAYNLLAPLISDAKTPFNLTTTYTNFYLPLGFTDGNTTVLTAKSGLVNISTLLPSLSGYATEAWVGQQGYALASSLSTVATSGSYNDLSDKPTIPKVYNGSLTIQKNGTDIITFSANSLIDVTANITVPTKTSDLTNDAGFIDGITSSMVTTALGYTPYNSTNPNGYQANVIETIKVNNVAQTVTSKTVNITVPSEVTETTVSGWGFTKNVGTVTSVNNVSPVNGNVTLSIPTVNNATLTIQKNGSTVKTFTANASSNVTCNITVPTKTSDLTNDSNFITGITSSMVTTALGYTPYNSTNPSGYQANVIETIKVNNVAQTVTSKTVNITVPSEVTETTVSGWGFTKNTGTVTSVNSTGPDSNGNVSITIPTVPTNVSAFTNDSNYIANTATGSNALTVGGTASGYTGGTNIGVSSQAKQNYGTALGYNTNANGNSSTCIGRNAGTSAASAIQIGAGVNSTANTLQVGFIHASTNWQLLDGTTGLIPSARIPIDGSTITVNASGQLQSAGGSGGANTNLSNLSATGKAVIDGQWVENYSELSTATATNSYNIDLSSYLPSDSYNYEVLLQHWSYRSGSNDCKTFIASDIITTDILIGIVNANSRQNVCCITIPVGTGRKLIYKILTNAANSTHLRAIAYRRIGTNT